MAPSGKKFLSPEKHRSFGQTWSAQIGKKESKEVFSEKDTAKGTPGRFNYIVDRLEGHTEPSRDITNLHRRFFIEQTIPEMLEKKKPGEKVKILISGDGMGLYANQIRKNFGDRVEVLSTGLSKKTSAETREYVFGKGQPESKLHPNDLKWHSVLELSDFPEFDLVIDTYGEQFHIQHQELSYEKLITEYLTAVAKKLKPGGLASIYPSHSALLLFSDAKIQALEKRLGVKIEFKKSTRSLCEITKLEDHA